MPNFKKLKNEEKVKILTLSETSGMSAREISSAIGCSNSTVSRFLKKYKDTGDIARKKGSGASRKTSAADDRLLTRMSLRDRFKTAVDLRAEFVAGGGNPVGVHTIRSRLREAGLVARRPAKKPLLTTKMKTARLEWAKKYVKWTEIDWRKVLFSDESKFNLFGSDGIQYVRRRTGERLSENCIQRTVKHPAGQMIWGCFSYYGVGELAFVQGMVNSVAYKKILEEHLFPSLENHFSAIGEVIFQDDSAPCHRSKMVSDTIFV